MRRIGCLFLAALAAPASTGGATIDSLSSLSYDENGKLATHVLLYSEEKCKGILDPKVSHYGYQSLSVTGEAEKDLFGSKEGTNFEHDCQAMCVERGVDQSLVSATLPHRYYNANSNTNVNEWFDDSCRRVEMCFMNYHSKTPLKLYWINHNGGKDYSFDLEYGEPKTKCIDTYIGHSFELDDGETDELVLQHTVEFTTIISAGQSPPYTGIEPDYTDRIHSTHRSEWSRHNRVKRSFSALGFRKGRLPDDVYASMGAFFYNNRNNKSREEWGGKGVYVNWWETDVFFIQIPWKLKGLWQDRLRELVEAWVGVELEQTDMYGLRQYEEGARLLTHVDREATHAASLIVNIAQGNLSEPWPVEVYDHADRLHEVPMIPGDIVYYESAKCLHGRNKPLKGEGAFYTNLFTHYRPTGDPGWFKRDNPEGTPEPLIDIGDCRLEGAIDQVGQGAVKCDNPAIGPYLSPTQFVARSGDDLSEWWRRTSPEPLKEPDSTAEEL